MLLLLWRYKTCSFYETRRYAWEKCVEDYHVSLYWFSMHPQDAVLHCLLCEWFEDQGEWVSESESNLPYGATTWIKTILSFSQSDWASEGMHGQSVSWVARVNYITMAHSAFFWIWTWSVIMVVASYQNDSLFRCRSFCLEINFYLNFTTRTFSPRKSCNVSRHCSSHV